jgi:arylsulfatase
VSADALTPGKNHILVEVDPEKVGQADAQGTTSLFVPRGPRAGDGKLTVNGKAEAEVHFANVNSGASETFDVGSDLGSPVSTDYQTPNRFTGKIDQVVIELK